MSNSNFTNNFAKFGAIVYHVTGTGGRIGDTEKSVMHNGGKFRTSDISFRDSYFSNVHATMRGAIIFSDFSDHPSPCPTIGNNNSDSCGTYPCATVGKMFFSPSGSRVTIKSADPMKVTVELRDAYRNLDCTFSTVTVTFGNLSKTVQPVNGSFAVSFDPSEIFFNSTTKKISMSVQSSEYNETVDYYLDCGDFFEEVGKKNSTRDLLFPSGPTNW